MSRRSYNQYCSIARALDVVGDRWTLLIIRELLIGPQRYTDLIDRLSGIGTNHLADRLKRLVSGGVARRRKLPPPAASTVYELTARGRGLEPVLVGLAAWGVELLGAPDAYAHWRADWSVVSLRGRFDAGAARGLREAYQFVVDDQPFFARVDDGALRTGLGHDPDPAVTVTTTRGPFTAIGAGERDLEEAIASGDVVVEGDVDALRRAATIFTAPQTQTDAA